MSDLHCNRLRLTLLALAMLGLGGCSSLDGASTRIAGIVSPYKSDIVQGNVVTREQLAAVKPSPVSYERPAPAAKAAAVEPAEKNLAESKTGWNRLDAMMRLDIAMDRAHPGSVPPMRLQMATEAIVR